MSRDPSARRPLARELFSVVVAFAIAFLFGRTILQSIGSLPYIVDVLVFLGLYAAAYLLLWRVSERMFRRR
jgi:hypothetical protein